MPLFKYSRNVLTYPVSVARGSTMQSAPEQHGPIMPPMLMQSPPYGIQSRDSESAEAEACIANAKTRSTDDFKNCIVERFGLEMK
jgi:hypothetical protein